MLLRELDGVIDENASVSVKLQSNNDFPITYSSWAVCKRSIKANAWDEEIKLTSYAGIQIVFINL